MEDVYTLLCLRSAEFSKAYSKISVVMLLEYRIAGISQTLELERKKALRPNTA